MADVVQKVLEDMLPELEDLQVKGIFTADEIKAIVAKRRDFEYLLRKRVADPADYTRYITYELQLEALRRKRKAKLAIKKTTRSDHGGIRHIHFIFDRACRKFGSRDVNWYLQWVDFALRTNSPKTVDRVFGKALTLHPTSEELWLQALAWQFDRQHNLSAARVLHQRALRINRSSKKLWLAAFQMECLYVLRIKGRRVTLGLDAGPTSIIASAALTAAMAGADEEEVEYDAQDGDPSKTLANMTSEETAMAHEEDETSPDARAAFLAGRVPIILYDAAIKESSLHADLEFRTSFLSALHGYRDVFAVPPAAAKASFDDYLAQNVPGPAFPDVAAHILETIARDFPDRADAWEVLAGYSLQEVKLSVDAFWQWKDRQAADGKKASQVKDDELFVVDKGADDESTISDAEESAGPVPATNLQFAMPYAAFAFQTNRDLHSAILSGAFETMLGLHNIPVPELVAVDAHAYQLPRLQPIPPFPSPLWATGAATEKTGGDASTVSGKKRKRTETFSTTISYWLPSNSVEDDGEAKQVYDLVRLQAEQAFKAMDAAVTAMDKPEMHLTYCRILKAWASLRLPSAQETNEWLLQVTSNLIIHSAAAGDELVQQLALLPAATPSDKARRLATSISINDAYRTRIACLLRLGRLEECLQVAAALAETKDRSLAAHCILSVRLRYGMYQAQATVPSATVTSGSDLLKAAVPCQHISLPLLSKDANTKLSEVAGAKTLDWVKAFDSLLQGARLCQASGRTQEAFSLCQESLLLLNIQEIDPLARITAAAQLMKAGQELGLSVPQQRSLRNAYVDIVLQTKYSIHERIAACAVALDLTAPPEAFAAVVENALEECTNSGGLDGELETALRRLLEDGVTAHGKTSPDLWLLYMSFERLAAPYRASRASAAGRADAAKDLSAAAYSRAIRTLDGAACLQFQERVVLQLK